MDRCCDGIVEPKKLQSLALDSFCGLLHTALEIANTEHSPLSETEVDFPHRVRRLLGFEREFCLSSVIADKLISCFSAREWLTSRILSAFCRSKIGTLRKVDVASCHDPSEEAFRLLLQQPLLELTLSVSMSGSTLMWWEHMEDIAGSPAAVTLSSLTINGPGVSGEDVRSFVRYYDSTRGFDWLKSLTCLNRLNLHHVDHFSTKEAKALGQVLVQLPNLAILNLAGTHIDDIEASMSNVKALSLSDLPIFLNPSGFSHILAWKSLVSLDLSTQVQNVSSHPEITQKLSELPNLRYLDLSGHTIRPSDLDCFDPPHPRMNFLGLLATGACRRKEFNCEVISGDANEEQFLTSLRTYLQRDRFMLYVLDGLHKFAVNGYLNTLQEELVIAILPLFEMKYLEDRLVLHVSACLWYLTKNSHKEKLSTHTIKKTVVALVKLMEKDYFHHLNVQAITNSVICFSHFMFPEEVGFLFTRVLQLLIRLSQMRHIETVERVALELMCDAMTEQSSTVERKVLARKLGGIKVALECIEIRVGIEKFDEALESAWLFLWNVTDVDDVPENCAELINCGGLRMFVGCFQMITAKVLKGQQYEDFQGVIEGMVGSVGALAESQRHRTSLVNPELLDILRSICENMKDPDVQHIVTWIIANLAMEDDRVWEGVTPSKDYMLCIIENVVDNWDFGQQFGCSYSGLNTVVAMVNFPNERVALWGVCALNHLCHIHPSRYFPMLRKERGVEALQKLLLRAETDRVKKLTSQILALVAEDKDIEEDMDRSLGKKAGSYLT